jgi:hypothetical protein
MSQPPDRTTPVNPLDPFGFWKQSQETLLESWSKSMIDAVNTDAYAETTGRMLDAYLTVAAPLRKIMEQTMTQVLSQLSLPSRAEVISLSERMTNIELRLDDLDARLDVIQRGVERTVSAVATLSAVSTTDTSAERPAVPRKGSTNGNRATAGRRAAGTSTSAAAQTTRTTRGSTARSRSKTE